MTTYYKVIIIVLIVHLKSVISEHVWNIPVATEPYEIKCSHYRKIYTNKFDDVMRYSYTEELFLTLRNFYTIRLAGGAVRDVLMGITPRNLYFATEAIPGEIMHIFKRIKIRTISSSSEYEGTITALLQRKELFQRWKFIFREHSDAPVIRKLKEELGSVRMSPK